MAEATLTPPAQPRTEPTQGIAPVPPVRPAPEDAPRRRPFTVDEFQKMAEAGIIGDQERVELIEGEVLEMSRIKSPHASCVRRMTRLLFEALGKRASIGVQDPIELDGTSEPEPDLFVAIYRDDEYRDSHPKPADLLLLIEVMDTSAEYDRRVKLPLYARAGIAEVWLVDLNTAVVEVHRRPLDGQYAEKQTYDRGQAVAPASFPDVVLAVDAIVSRVEP